MKVSMSFYILVHVSSSIINVWSSGQAQL